jgi:long-chain fatty acid transport protein
MKNRPLENLFPRRNAKITRHILRSLVAIVFLWAVRSEAEGFRDATIGALDLGRSGGRIAQVDDSTAVQNNPANLVDITNTEVQLAPSVIYFHVHYDSPDGSQSASTIHPLKDLPNFFASVPIADGQAALGIGVTVPYGLGNQWNTSASAWARPNGVLSTATANFGKLTTFNFNPTLAVKLGDHLQAGFGLDMMWSELEFRQFINPAVAEQQAHASGSGLGLGGNLGITWKITDHQRLALAYRSTMTVDFNGTAELEYVTTPNPAGPFNSQIKFPNIISLGYGIDLTDKIRLESDMEWLQFSEFKNLPIQVGGALSALSQSIPENWHNTFTAGIGGDWKFADHWVARAGYEFFKSPVPDNTFSPLIPDADQNVFTVGLGWKGQHASLELAYGLDFYNNRNITDDQNPALNGKYTFNVHLFSLAFRYNF